MSEEELRAKSLETVRAYQNLLTQQRWDDWIGLWADDGVLEFPFAPAGRRSVYRGKEDILGYMSRTPGKVAIESITRMAIHPMQNPENVTVELTIKGRAVETGGDYDQSYVLFFELKGGKIVAYREYWNPLVSMDAFGGREAWTASFGN